MTDVTPETFGTAYHAAGLALCEKIARNFRQHCDHPVGAWIAGLGPRPAHVPDPHARTERREDESKEAA